MERIGAERGKKFPGLRNCYERCVITDRMEEIESKYSKPWIDGSDKSCLDKLVTSAFQIDRMTKHQ